MARFLILDEPIPGSEISSLLGRFTYDYTSPLDRYAPAQLPLFVSKYIKEYGDQTAASIATQSTRSESLQSKLHHVLSLASSRTALRRYDIDSAVIKTYRLHDHDNAFDALMADLDVKQQVDALFRRPRQRTNRVYMIVGLKTLFDARVRSERGRSRNEEVNADVPIGATLNAIGVTVPPGTVQAGTQWQREADMNLVSSATHEGEQVFAVEYRVIKKTLFRSDVSLGRTKRWEWGEGVMGASADSDSEDDEESHEHARLPSLTKTQIVRRGGEYWDGE